MKFQHEKAILPALLTPFDHSGNIAFQSLNTLIDRLVDEGVDGFYAMGSSSEAFLLSTEERMAVLDAVTTRVAGRAPVIAMVGHTNPRESKALAKHAKSSGADAISAVPPFYYKYSTEEIKRFYLDLADAAELPVLVYNVSIYTGVDFSMQNAGDLMRDQRVLGIKHTNFNLYHLNRFKAALPDKIIFNGFDECLLGGLSMGADGAIGTTYNAFAPLAMRIRDLFVENRMEEALQLQNALNTFVDALQVAGGIAGTKYALTLQGIDLGPCREPNRPISEAGKEAIERAIEQMPKI